MRHKGSNPAHSKANGKVTVRVATATELAFRRKPGYSVNRYIKNQREIGDKMPMFGKEYIAFKGGEGGRNWSINPNSKF